MTDKAQLFDATLLRQRLYEAKDNPLAILGLYQEVMSTLSTWSSMVLADLVKQPSPFALEKCLSSISGIQYVEAVKDLVQRVRSTGAYEKREPVDKTVEAPITPNAITGGFEAIEGRDLRVAAIVFNPRDYADVRMFGRDIIEIESQASFLRLGLMGTVWGALMIADKQQPVREVMFLGEVRDEDKNLMVSANAIHVLKVLRP